MPVIIIRARTDREFIITGPSALSNPKKRGFYKKTVTLKILIKAFFVND
jgi:hypothetical protein